MKKICVVDYGVGNIFSVAHALEKCGAQVKLVTYPEEILVADKLILPGVGAFGDCIAEIRKRELDSAIVEYANSGKLLFGICVGMQVMMTKSFEFGEHAGLNLIAGSVERIPDKKLNGSGHKVPYVGWAKIQMLNSNPIINGINDNWGYFVHSYEVKTHNVDDLAAYYNYNGNKIAAVILKNNIIGCQFHPEKSGTMGLRLLEQFIIA